MSGFKNWRSLYTAKWLLIGSLPLATGAALIVHVVTLLSLGIGLLTAAILVGGVAWFTWTQLTPDQRIELRRRAMIGLGTGLVATIGYDLARLVLVTSLALTFWPFDVFPIFGQAIIGNDAPRVLTIVVGTAYHYLNGMFFALAYTILLAPYGWWAGLLWAFGLETLMLAIYPGWLHPKAFAEFASISFVGHVVYGIILGSLGRFWWQKTNPAQITA